MHATDVTNASRYNLMDLSTCTWSQAVCDFYDIPITALPTIRSSSEIYGTFTNTALQGIPICGILGAPALSSPPICRRSASVAAR